MQLKTIAVAITFALGTAAMPAVAQDYGNEGGAEGQGRASPNRVRAKARVRAWVLPSSRPLMTSLTKS